ncbi:MAG: acetyl-CoA carboxylase biotin carboxyl carrier protein [Deltaproteobacteria bacterium]|nr:acetyl-CoA carboxylase biotin carboxyl carrier protein [Deltaproteobacteria bacterium]
MDIKGIKEIKNLVQLMSESDLTELTIEKKDLKLTLKREKAYYSDIQPTFTPKLTGAQPSLESPQAGDGGQTAVEAAFEKDHHFVTAPLVGTFYSASAPDAPPFAQVGDKVKKGQILCIIEAMKLMNEIECDVNGVIVEVCCENASPVEYGTRIFAIKVG